MNREPPAAPAWPGREASGSVVLPIDAACLPDLEATLVLLEGRLQLKREFHMTLLSADEARSVAQRLPEERWAAVFDRLTWTMALLDRWHLLHEPARKSVTEAQGQGTADAPVRTVIAELDCPALNDFRRALADASGATLPDTLPHVTLWIAGSDRGIGLASMAEFHARQVRELTAAERHHRR